MTTTITISSKGQITVPSEFRKKLHLKEGDRLTVRFDEVQGSMVLNKALSIEDLSKYLTSKIKPGTEPVLNVDEYYQAHRTPRI